MKFSRINDEINYYIKKYEVSREIETMFVKAGCVNIKPNIFEDYDSFASLNCRVKKESTVKVLNSGSKILILRPDITMNIVENLLPRWEEELKLKLFYNSSVFKNRAGLKVEEIEQIGVEYLGQDRAVSDVEIIGLVMKVLKKYSDNFILELGSSKYIEGLLNEICISEAFKKELKDLIFKKNQVELDKFIEKLNLDEKVSELVSNILRLQGSIATVVLEAEKYYMNETMKEAIRELNDLNSFIVNGGYSNNTHLDLSVVTELDYYDGIIFKGYYPNLSEAIIKGGRYDSLTEILGRKISAIGFSIDLKELMKTILKGGGDNWNI